MHVDVQGPPGAGSFDPSLLLGDQAPQTSTIGSGYINFVTVSILTAPLDHKSIQMSAEGEVDCTRRVLAMMKRGSVRNQTCVDIT